MSDSITDLIKETLSNDNAKQAKELAQALINKAKEGNASIAKLIFDRIDGPAQSDEKEPLSEEERIERITVILDRARERRDRQASRKSNGRN